MKKMFLSIIFVPLMLLLMVPAIYSQCVTMEDDLSLKLPCVEYNGNYYQLHLTSYHNPADPDWPYWQYESVQSAPSKVEYARIDADLNITVPSVCYAGYNMAIALESYLNPADPGGLYWKLDPSITLNKLILKPDSDNETRCFDISAYNSPELRPALMEAVTCIQYCGENVPCLTSCAVKSPSWETVASIIAHLLTSNCESDASWAPAPGNYTGTLTVLQKDAYRNTGGRSSELWPPHTTTVFEWKFGREVQTNHGTAPGEVDASGKPFLVETMVYTFSGTRSQMEALQAAYKKAIYDDDTHQFISLTNGKTVLEKSFLDGLKDYLADGANGLVCTGSVTREKLLAFLKAEDFHGFAVAMESCSWGKDEWETAFETILNDVVSELGYDLLDFHVCNDDASLQVGLIKHYIETGEIEIPRKQNDGPMWYFKPEAVVPAR